jgi:hypothetical protein
MAEIGNFSSGRGKRTMSESVDRMSRHDRICEAYRRAVGDHDHSPRSITDYLSTKDFLPAIRAAVPDATLEEVCAVRWEDEKLVHCPAEIEQEHASWCLQVPTGYPTDPDLIGPFDTYSDAKAFTEAHPERCREAHIRCMGTPTFEILCEHEFKAYRARFASKLGVASDVLEPLQAPRDMVVEISATVAREVAQYLERNYPVPYAQEICTLLRTIATTAGVAVYPRDTPRPAEPQTAE